MCPLYSAPRNPESPVFREMPDLPDLPELIPPLEFLENPDSMTGLFSLIGCSTICVLAGRPMFDFERLSGIAGPFVRLILRADCPLISENLDRDCLDAWKVSEALSFL